MPDCVSPVLVGVDYREPTGFHGDYTLGRTLCDLLLAAGRSAYLYNINDPLDETLAEWPDPLVFVQVDSFAPESPNARAHPRRHGLRLALEERGVEFVGSRFEAYRRSSSFDKVAARRHLAGVARMPRGHPIDPGRPPAREGRTAVAEVGLPLVLKIARRTGGSVGVRYVDRRAELCRLLEDNAATDRRPLLAEEYVRGRELTAWVMDSGSEPRCYGVAEIKRPPGAPILYNPLKLFCTHEEGAGEGPFDRAVVSSPPALGPRTVGRVGRAAVAAHRRLGLRHYSRTDFILRGSRLFLIEVNASPQIGDNHLGSIARAAGRGLAEAVGGLVDEVRAAVRSRRAEAAAAV